MSVQVTGLKQLIASLRNKAKASDAEIKKALYEAGLVVETEAKRNVKKAPRGGRIYKKYNPKRTHQASAPFTPAADDTGRLANSITTVPVPDANAVVVKAAASLAPYALALEFGTADGKIKPRPFMRPAMYAKKGVAQELIRRAIKKAMEQK